MTIDLTTRMVWTDMHTDEVVSRCYGTDSPITNGNSSKTSSPRPLARAHPGEIDARSSTASSGSFGWELPGSIEQREFDYTRHGTVNLLVFLVVHTGRMRAVDLDQNNAANYIPALRQCRRRHRRLRSVYLIHDGGLSHIAGVRTECFGECQG